VQYYKKRNKVKNIAMYQAWRFFCEKIKYTGAQLFDTSTRWGEARGVAVVASTIFFLLILLMLLEQN